MQGVEFLSRQTADLRSVGVANLKLHRIKSASSSVQLAVPRVRQRFFRFSISSAYSSQKIEEIQRVECTKRYISSSCERYTKYYTIRSIFVDTIRSGTGQEEQVEGSRKNRSRGVEQVRHTLVACHESWDSFRFVLRSRRAAAGRAELLAN